MMKFNILFSVFLFFGVVNSSGQVALDTDGLNNLNNVYLFSLKEYCQTLDSLKIKTVYVKYDYFIGESWPRKINSFEIKYLTSNEYKNAIKAEGGHMVLVGITSLRLEKGTFYVGVIPFGASYKKKTVHLGNGGGLTVNFTYDPIQKALVFRDKKWGGI